MSDILAGGLRALRKDSSASFKQAVSILPHGLEVVGVLGLGCTRPEWPADVPPEARGLPLLATRAEDGQVKAWEMKSGRERNTWQIAEPSEICAYSSLSIVLPTCQVEAIALLRSMLRSIAAEMRFRFPGTQMVPSMADLRADKDHKLDVLWKPTESGTASAVAVEVFFEALGNDERSNVMEFQCQAPPRQRIDFAAYVPANSTARVVAHCLVEAATFQLNRVLDEVSAQRLGNDGLAVRCYLLEILGHAVCLRGTEDQNIRRELHQLLRLPQVPLLVPSAALALAGQAGDKH